MGFDEAAVDTFVNNVVSHASSLGIFRAVNAHEPKASPGSGLRYAVWAQRIEPLAGASGLNSTSGYVVVNGRIYGNMLQKPEDETDPRMMKAATTLIGAYSGDFDFGGTARNVDLLGMYGEKLQAVAGYLSVGDGMYRVMTIVIPVVFNDMWSQVA
jgi:hypothetical protein